ncbi:unnamed protein product [Ambrosiozyma monospora]|uniref:Unnamed protein product n=1 Tax=Ambrosiozyma monospora TaxID=43982 RepID=A0A9W7DC57_AMBMO|nr:unnamed protein product [Ambrosiozyma monospora]
MTLPEKQQEEEQEIAVLLLDTLIPNLKQFGDFADLGIKLLTPTDKTNQKTYKFHKYDIITKQEFPTPLQLANTKAVYLTGSRSDSFETSIEWISKTIEFIRDLWLNYPHMKLIGICFGHQLIALALGLQTGRNLITDSNGKAQWEMGLTQIQLNVDDSEVKQLFTTPDSAIPKKGHLNMIEMHQDVVLPSSQLDIDALLSNQGIHNIGSTKICKYQGFYKPGSMLSFQGHPEFNLEYSQLCIMGRFKNGIIDSEYFEDTKSRAKELVIDDVGLKDVILKFID